MTTTKMIRLAASLPKGSPERRRILSSLSNKPPASSPYSTSIRKVSEQLRADDPRRKHVTALLKSASKLNGKMFPKNSFLRRFFDEKEVPETTFQVDVDGELHMIPNEVVLEHIALTTGKERETIEMTLRKLDMANKSINHYLEFLAKAIAKNYRA